MDFILYAGGLLVSPFDKSLVIFISRASEQFLPDMVTNCPIIKAALGKCTLPREFKRLASV